MHIPVLCIVIGCFAYIAVAAVMIRALGRVRGGESSVMPRVSVILAAHNEESVIGVCLDSLYGQDYPPDRFEIIAADDRSTDRTPELLAMYSREGLPLRTVRIDRVPAGVSPKKNALAAAVSQATGEIILQTDADCAAPSGWIRGMIGRFEPGVGFVAGVAPYRKTPGMLNSFIRHEYLWNAALSAASIALGGGTHASGRNMGFRRDVFEMLEGYGDSSTVLSGDDTLLLQRIIRSGAARAATMPGPETHVFTDAPATFGGFVRQRIRHMSTGRYFNSGQILTGAVVYGFHALLLGAIAAACFLPALRFPAVAGFGWKTAVDALAARQVRSVIGLDVEWSRFFVNEFLLLIYMTVFPLAGLVVPVSWKRSSDTERKEK